MEKYIGDLNPQRLAKVTEAAATVKPSKYDRDEVVKKQPEPVA